MIPHGWQPIGEPDIQELSPDAARVFSIMQCMDNPHIGIIRMKTRFGDDRIIEAIYEIRKMEAIRMGKLTNQQRAAIYAASKDGVPQKDLAKQYDVSIQAISQLINKLAKAEQEIMQPAAEDKPKPGIINPEFDAAVDAMIAESKSADVEEPAAIAESDKLPPVVRQAIEVGYRDLIDKINECRSQIEDLEAMISEYEKDIEALKKMGEGESMKALKISLNSITIVDIENELRALQQAVGGHIETVGLRDGGVMIVDEEGILKQYPHNDTASYISGRHIYGTALIVGADGEEFDDVPESYLTLLSCGEA